MLHNRQGPLSGGQGPLSGGLNPRPPRWEAPTVRTTTSPSTVQCLSVALKTADGASRRVPVPQTKPSCWVLGLIISVHTLPTFCRPLLLNDIIIHCQLIKVFLCKLNKDK